MLIGRGVSWIRRSKAACGAGVGGPGAVTSGCPGVRGRAPWGVDGGRRSVRVAMAFRSGRGGGGAARWAGRAAPRAVGLGRPHRRRGSTGNPHRERGGSGQTDIGASTVASGEGGRRRRSGRSVPSQLPRWRSRAAVASGCPSAARSASFGDGAPRSSGPAEERGAQRSGVGVLLARPVGRSSRAPAHLIHIYAARFRELTQPRFLTQQAGRARFRRDTSAEVQPCKRLRLEFDAPVARVAVGGMKKSHQRPVRQDAPHADERRRSVDRVCCLRLRPSVDPSAMAFVVVTRSRTT
jgi:hypothetical protein